MQYRINALLNSCYKDTDKPGIEFQLFLITVKCLMPHEDKIGCFFDADRYEKEIDLFAHYKNGEDETINYRIEYKKPATINDNLLEYKIIPIILANTVWDNLLDEVLKAVTFYTLNKNTLINSIIIASAIYEYMEGSEDFNITKERLINFSIKDFFKKYNIETDNNYIIDFEKERIKMISKCDLFSDIIENYKSLNYISNKPVDDMLEKEVIDNFSSYLYKLRKGIISPEKLKIPDKMPELRECLKYPAFSHPLLGRCKIIKRTEHEVFVRNKSGIMRIRI